MLVVEATWQSLLTVRRIKRLANEIRTRASRSS